MARELRNPNFSEPFDKEIYWKTKDGRLVLISEMTDIHIRNAIAFFRRKNISEDYYRPLLKEIEFRRFLDSGEDKLEL